MSKPTTSQTVECSEPQPREWYKTNNTVKFDNDPCDCECHKPGFIGGIMHIDACCPSTSKESSPYGGVYATDHSENNKKKKGKRK
jgi:hypothetical protein